MTSKDKELRVRLSHVHHDTHSLPHRHIARFERSDRNYWAAAFETHHGAEAVAQTVRTTMCKANCPRTNKCSQARVEETEDRIHRFIVIASSLQDIFHKGSRATCVRHSRK